MLPAALVTLVTFLLKLCSTSPVYNMQPAFITNTVGSTAGRNIRNLPCISRRNSNQSGFCMFAIDCLKANGTHLGTCIDGFYFGSCCHIEPIRDIVDNNIDTDIIPQREPPFRISSTTMRSISTSTPLKNETSTMKVSLSSSTMKTVGVKITTSSSVSSIGSTKPVSTSTIGQNVTDSKSVTSTPSSTVYDKLQTFQVVESNTLEEGTTKASVATSSPISKKPVTEVPVVSSSRKPSTKAPTIITPTASKGPINSSSSSTSSKPMHPASLPTTDKTATTTTSRSPYSDITSKTTKITKSPSKPTQKPIKVSTERPVLTKKPQDATKVSVATTTTTTTTAKPSKSTVSTTKPTKRSTTTTKTTTTKYTTTEKLVVTKPSAVNHTLISSSSSHTTLPPTINTTSSSFSLLSTTEISKMNTSQTIDTVSGNVATNEIDGTQDLHTQEVQKLTTIKPGLITWTVVDNKNITTIASEYQSNTTTEDWVRITTPDGWVLLPNVLSNTTVSTIVNSSTSSPSISTSSSMESTTEPSTLSTLGPITLPTPFVKPVVSSTTPSAVTEATTSDITTTNEGESNASNSETTIAGSSSSSPPIDNFDRPVNMSDFTEVCGRRMFPAARIVGGEKSSFGKWPWQISLRQWRTSTYLHKCGAALLNENWAITAAHCVDNVPPSDLLLRLGEHDLSTESEPYLHQERRVQIVASHPQFDPRTFEYDLALLRFYEPVTFQPNILPVCVPQTDENFVGRTAYVTGWGRLYEDGPLPSILQEVSVPVINNTVCESMYRAAGYIEHIPHIFICAGWRRGGFDSCEGDSGGPMVIQRQDNRFLLAGVISWGIGCAEPNQPGVYTRISEFRDWINQILQF